MSDGERPGDPVEAGFNPYAAPQAPLGLEPLPPEELQPLPLEDPERYPGWWSRVFRTLGLGFAHPMEFLARVPAGSGLVRPWILMLVCAVPGFLLLGGLLSLVSLVSLSGTGNPGNSAGTVLGSMGAVLGMAALGWSVFGFLAMVLNGLLTHLGLLVFGALRPGNGLRQTMRAWGYAYAFTALSVFLPYLNSLISLAIVGVLSAGMSRVHGCRDTWRGVLGTLLPLLLMYALFFIAVFVIIALAVTQGH